MTTTTLLWKRRRPYAYTKLEREDPEEIEHRRAQFLIYKVLQQVAVDSPKRRKSRLSSWFRVKICRLKIKLGKKLKKLKKNLSLAIGAAAKGAAHKQVTTQLRPWKRLFTIPSS